MKQQSFHIIISLLIILLPSCQIINPRFFNSPSTQATAFLEKKGDGKISANISVLPKEEHGVYELGLFPTETRKSKSYGFDVSAAYAFSDQFMATLGGEYKKERDLLSSNDILQTRSSSRIDYTRKALDVGLGMMITNDNPSLFVFNPIVGVNAGRSESFFKNTSDTIYDNRVFHFHGNSLKFYVKPNLNFHISKNFKMSFVPQFSLIKYRDIDDNYSLEARENLGLNRLRKESLYLFEPGNFYQIGFNKVDWLKLDLGVVFSIYPNASRQSDKLRTRNLQFFAGFSIYP